jgi:GTP-binding protein YchF
MAVRENSGRANPHARIAVSKAEEFFRMLHAALIGFPSTGKSTLFQLMTSAKDAPRGKGDTVIGISKVPDPRLDRLAGMFNPKKTTPATIEFTDMVAPGRTGAAALVDVAGYKNADALVHVVRAFRDPSVPHPAGSVDPARDAQAMEDELLLADLGVVERRLERMEKDAKKNKSAELDKEKDLLARCRVALENGQPLRALGLAGEDVRRLRGFQLLSAKPLLIVINLDEADADAAASVERAAELTGMTAFLSREGTRAAALCAKIELEIAALEPADAEAFLKDMGLTESGLNRVIRASYDLLGYMSFLTVGEDECRAWSIRRGTSALDAAGEIHSDISRGFIRAEVVGYDAFIARGTMAACRDSGELRLEGKEYVVQDGDIINFRHAT